MVSDNPPTGAPPSRDTATMVLSAVGFEGALSVVAVVAGLFMEQPPWLLLSLDLPAVAWGLVATVPLLVGLLALRRIRSGAIGHLNDTMDRHLLPLFAGAPLVALAAIALLAGVGEELLFRGVVQQLLERWTTPMTGLLWASLLFGVAHWITPAYALLATLVGIYFGALWWLSGNLLAPIVAHAVYDFIALVFLTWSVRHPTPERP